MMYNLIYYTIIYYAIRRKYAEALNPRIYRGYVYVLQGRAYCSLRAAAVWHRSCGILGTIYCGTSVSHVLVLTYVYNVYDIIILLYDLTVRDVTMVHGGYKYNKGTFIDARRIYLRNNVIIYYCSVFYNAVYWTIILIVVIEFYTANRRHIASWII